VISCSQPSLAVSALQSPRPGSQVSAQLPAMHSALLALPKLQVCAHEPQLVTLSPYGVPTLRSTHSAEPEQVVSPAWQLPPVPVSPPVPVVPPISLVSPASPLVAPRPASPGAVPLDAEEPPVPALEPALPAFPLAEPPLANCEDSASKSTQPEPANSKRPVVALTLGNQDDFFSISGSHITNIPVGRQAGSPDLPADKLPSVAYADPPASRWRWREAQDPSPQS
jgi:hypothetical protein